MYGSIFYFVDNYESPTSVDNCVFVNNSAYYSLIDISVSSATISNTKIQNNTNNLFSLVSATLIFQNNQIKNLICLTGSPGCILRAKEASFLQIKSSSFANVTSIIEEGNIYLDSSKVFIDTIEMTGLKTPKKGSCFSSFNCSFSVINSNFFDYDLNCINAYESNLTINNSIFNNSKVSQYKKKFEFGTVFSSSSREIIIFNSSFIKNSNIMDGSALCIIAKPIDNFNQILISDSVFWGNSAFGKGTVYIYNQNFSISYSNFTNNIVQNGGGIYCNNDGLIII